MDIGFIHSPQIVIPLAVLGFAVLVAGLDFAKRRAAAKRSSPVAAPPAKAIAVQTTPVAEPQKLAPIGAISSLPHTDRAAPSLPIGSFLPLPKPNPSLPRNRVIRHADQPVGACRLQHQ
jgi:hypothetical protein